MGFLKFWTVWTKLQPIVYKRLCFSNVFCMSAQFFLMCYRVKALVLFTCDGFKYLYEIPLTVLFVHFNRHINL